MSRPKEIKGIKKQIPNLLSFFRLALSPFFVICLKRDETFLAVVMLVFAGLSDFFDGYLARKFKVASRFGEALDPFADKIFLNAVLWGIYLFRLNSFSFFLLTIFLTCRDSILIIGSVFAVLSKIKREIKPIFLSKLCTALIFILCIAAIVFQNNSFLDFFSFICTTLILITSFFYVKRFLFKY